MTLAGRMFPSRAAERPSPTLLWALRGRWPLSETTEAGAEG
jgi:hypothetical protein